MSLLLREPSIHFLSGPCLCLPYIFLGVFLRIAQIAPLAERVPPRFYGGTERVVSYLTEELVRRGHEVSLFASGDSVTSATLVPGAPNALRLEHSVKDP